MRIVVVVALLLAGCVEPESAGKESNGDEEPKPAPPSGFWFVEVRGRHAEEREEGLACGAGYPSPPEVDVDARTIRFLNERFDVDSTEFLVVGVTWMSSPCAYAQSTVLPSDGPLVHGGFAGFGNVTFEFQQDGTVEVLGQAILEGQSAGFNTTGRTARGMAFSSNLTVYNHGMWQKDSLTLAPTYD